MPPIGDFESNRSAAFRRQTFSCIAISVTSLLAGCCLPVLAQVAVVRQLPALRRDVAALPHIEGIDSAVMTKVNLDSDRANAALQIPLRHCDIDYRKWSAMMTPAVQAHAEGDWKRIVRVTMKGPRYLSILITDQTFCGGAHPNFSQTALVYDLTDGSAVLWEDAMQGSTRWNPEEPYWDGMLNDQIQNAGLRRWYLVRLSDPQCRAISPKWVEPSFIVYLDASSKQAMVVAGNLPHVSQVCAQTIPLSQATAIQLGFPPRILRALSDAQ